MKKIKEIFFKQHWMFPLDENGSYYPNDWGYLYKDMNLAEFAEAIPEQLGNSRNRNLRG